MKFSNILPLFTPYNSDLSLDTGLFVTHAKQMLADQTNMIVPFSTVGESPCLGMNERMALLEALLGSGVPAQAVVPGTGVSALADTITLTRHAIDLGTAAAMLVPPYSFEEISEKGLLAYFSKVIESVGGSNSRFYISRNSSLSSVPVPDRLILRLADMFPGLMSGIIDEGHPARDGSHSIEPADQGVDNSGGRSIAGSTGCQSRGPLSSVSLSAAQAIAGTKLNLIASDAMPECCRPYLNIPVLKAILAARDNVPGWTRVRPPLVELECGAAAELSMRVNHERDNDPVAKFGK